jgi:hypothetical protein
MYIAKSMLLYSCATIYCVPTAFTVLLWLNPSENRLGREWTRVDKIGRSDGVRWDTKKETMSDFFSDSTWHRLITLDDVSFYQTILDAIGHLTTHASIKYYPISSDYIGHDLTTVCYNRPRCRPQSPCSSPPAPRLSSHELHPFHYHETSC